MDQKLFHGPHDRLAWVAAFLVLWFLAPFALFAWKGKKERRGGAKA